MKRERCKSLQIFLTAFNPKFIHIIQTFDDAYFCQLKTNYYKNAFSLAQKKLTKLCIAQSEKRYEYGNKIISTELYILNESSVDYSKCKNHIINRASAVPSCKKSLNTAKPAKSID